MTGVLPTEFLRKCDASERERVQAWWDSLDDPNQSVLRILLDRRHDSIAYVYKADEEGDFDWHELPFVDEELPMRDEDPAENEWQIEFFEHLLDRPEMYAWTEVRTFHICSTHQSAQEVLASGKLDCNFACSDHNPNCPIHRFMRDLKSAQLVGHSAKNGASLWLCNS